MLDVIVMKLPRSMDHRAILFNLLGGQWSTTFDKAMRGHRHDVGRTIRQPDPGPGKRHLHHVLGKVAGIVEHVLMSRCDIATGRVVVSAKVRGDTTSFTYAQQKRNIYF